MKIMNHPRFKIALVWSVLFLLSLQFTAPVFAETPMESPPGSSITPNFTGVLAGFVNANTVTAKTVSAESLSATNVSADAINSTNITNTGTVESNGVTVNSVLRILNRISMEMSGQICFSAGGLENCGMNNQVIGIKNGALGWVSTSDIVGGNVWKDVTIPTESAPVHAGVLLNGAAKQFAGVLIGGMNTDTDAFDSSKKATLIVNGPIALNGKFEKNNSSNPVLMFTEGYPQDGGNAKQNGYILGTNSSSSTIFTNLLAFGVDKLGGTSSPLPVIVLARTTVNNVGVDSVVIGNPSSPTVNKIGLNGTTSIVGNTSIKGATNIEGNSNIKGELNLGSNSKGITLNAANKPLITRDWDAFTSGDYVGVGKWGLFMEPNALTIGIPNSGATKMFKVKAFNDDSTGVDLMTVNAGGNVGIGTYQPTAKLSIYNDDGSLGDGLGKSSNGIEFSTWGSELGDRKLGEFNLAGIWPDRKLEKGGGLVFGTNPVGVAVGSNVQERMRISSNGNVYIGWASLTNPVTVSTNGVMSASIAMKAPIQSSLLNTSLVSSSVVNATSLNLATTNLSAASFTGLDFAGASASVVDSALFRLTGLNVSGNILGVGDVVVKGNIKASGLGQNRGNIYGDKIGKFYTIDGIPGGSLDGGSVVMCNLGDYVVSCMSKDPGATAFMRPEGTAFAQRTCLKNPAGSTSIIQARCFDPAGNHVVQSGHDDPEDPEDTSDNTVDFSALIINFPICVIIPYLCVIPNLTVNTGDGAGTGTTFGPAAAFFDGADPDFNYDYSANFEPLNLVVDEHVEEPVTPALPDGMIEGLKNLFTTGGGADMSTFVQGMTGVGSDAIDVVQTAGGLLNNGALDLGGLNLDGY